MSRKVVILIACSLLTICCSRENPYGKSETMSNTVASQAQLDEGNQRINAFKQELLGQGFREVSSSTSDSKEQVVLKGHYGTLKDLEVTLWTGRRLEVKEPQLGGGVRASLAGAAAERDFDELYKRVEMVVTGHPR